LLSLHSRIHFIKYFAFYIASCLVHPSSYRTEKLACVYIVGSRIDRMGFISKAQEAVPIICKYLQINEIQMHSAALTCQTHVFQTQWRL
jgi:hypothetical protein